VEGEGGRGGKREKGKKKTTGPLPISSTGRGEPDEIAAGAVLSRKKEKKEGKEKKKGYLSPYLMAAMLSLSKEGRIGAGREERGGKGEKEEKKKKNRP